MFCQIYLMSCSNGSNFVSTPAVLLKSQLFITSVQAHTIFKNQFLLTIFYRESASWVFPPFTLCAFYINTNNILLFRFMKIHLFPTKKAYKFLGGCLKHLPLTNQKEKLKGTYYVAWPLITSLSPAHPETLVTSIIPYVWVYLPASDWATNTPSLNYCFLLFKHNSLCLTVQNWFGNYQMLLMVFLSQYKSI